MARSAAYRRQISLLLPEGLAPFRSARWRPVRQTLPSPDPLLPPNSCRRAPQDLPPAHDAPAVQQGHPPPQGPRRPCGATPAAAHAPPRCRPPALSSRARRSRWRQRIRAVPPLLLYRWLPLAGGGARSARLVPLGLLLPLGPPHPQAS